MRVSFELCRQKMTFINNALWLLHVWNQHCQMMANKSCYRENSIFQLNWNLIQITKMFGYIHKIHKCLKITEKSPIQKCELRLHFEWTKVDKKCPKWSISFLEAWSLRSNSFTRHVTFGDKYQSWKKFKFDIFGNFQTLWDQWGSNWVCEQTAKWNFFVYFC